ncbi:hypothetical protein J3459_007757 [Metarhizium acridum]|nr:hypothetical protein J3459_007757 [Metarhizium acridum]
MGSTDFGNFQRTVFRCFWFGNQLRIVLWANKPMKDFCKDSTLPVSVFRTETRPEWPLGRMPTHWNSAEQHRHLANLGSIILCGAAIATSLVLLLRSERETGGCWSQVFSAIHIGMIIATTWILMLNAVIGYQLIDDGTPLSVGLLIVSAGVLFIGTGYIALDTGLKWTGYWNSSYDAPNRNIALYVLYQLIPLIFLVAFFVLEAVLVLRVLGEIRPMIYLTTAALLFAIGQVFNYAISRFICDGTSGAIDGAFITEDDWPMQTGASYD